jgi:hypothetical protein
MSLALRVVTFDITEQSQKEEWSHHQDIELPGEILRDTHDKAVVDVALKSFEFEFVGGEHFIMREYVNLEVSNEGHSSCRVKARARWNTVNPSANSSIKFRGRIEALVIADMKPRI